MELIVDAFENETQRDFVERYTPETCWTSWSACLRKQGSNSAIGAIDPMMKKDKKAIVRAYKNLVKKRGESEFTKGDYVIELRPNDSVWDPAEVINCKIV